VLLSVDMAGTADVAGRHILLVSTLQSCLCWVLLLASLASLLGRADLASIAHRTLCLLHLLHHTPPSVRATHACDPAPHTKRRRPAYGPAPLASPRPPLWGLGVGGGLVRGRRRRVQWRVSSASVAQSERGRA